MLTQHFCENQRALPTGTRLNMAVMLWDTTTPAPRPSVLIHKHCFPSSDQRSCSMSVLLSRVSSIRLLIAWKSARLSLWTSFGLLDYQSSKRSPVIPFALLLHLMVTHLWHRYQEVSWTSQGEKSGHEGLSTCQVCWQQAQAGKHHFYHSYCCIITWICLSFMHACAAATVEDWCRASSLIQICVNFSSSFFRLNPEVLWCVYSRPLSGAAAQAFID